MGVPYTFGTATTSIPLSNLDANFNTPVTIGNATVGLGNTVTTVGNLTLTNATISSGNVTVTTGIFGAGTVSAPAITTTGDTNTGIFFPAADTIAFTEGGVESARFDSAGNLGIGTTSPAGVGKLAVKTSSTSTGAGLAVISSANDSFLTIYNSGSVHNIGATYSSTGSYQPVAFLTSDVERMRIDSSGNLLIGKTTTTNTTAGVQFTPAGTAAFTFDTGGDGPCTQFVNPNASVVNGYRFISFRINAGASEIGTITNNNSTGVLYNVTSDYRLKNVIAPVTNAGERLDLLEPIEYDWKSSGIRAKGFLAHKFAEVYPNSVNGEKDAVDEEGKPAYQGMQPSSAEVMADLIAEIQSLRKRVAQLESK